MIRTSLAALAFAAAIALAPGLPAGADEGHPAVALAGSDSAPGASGSVEPFYRRARVDIVFRAEGLEGRENHAIRLEDGAGIGTFRARRSGRGKFVLRSDRRPEDLPWPITGLPVEVVRLRDGAVVLSGLLPGTAAGGGGGGGGGDGGGGDGGGGGGGGTTPPVTRLPGVDERLR